MTPPTPKYLALPMASGDCAVLAIFPDGNLAISYEVASRAIGRNRETRWLTLTPPDYADLFPAPAYTEQAGVGDALVNVGTWKNGWSWRCRCPDRDARSDSISHCEECDTHRPPPFHAVSDPF